MVTKWGMSDKVGPVALESDGGKPLFGGAMSDKGYSEKISALIDAEVSKIIIDGRKEAERILIKHKDTLDVIAQKLIEVETLERKEFEEILIANGIVPKKKLDIEHSPLVGEK
jgi:cell division protease FtsH